MDEDDSPPVEYYYPDEDEEAAELESCTPPDIIEIALAAKNSLLPDKSKDRYEKTYAEFTAWQKSKNTNSFSQRVMIAYFLGLSKKSKPSSLWAYYSMLKKTILIKHNIDLKTYAELISFLKKESKNYIPTRAKVFTPDEMKRFIQEADDLSWLDVKVVCIFGLYGATRTDELPKILLEHIEKQGELFLVNLPETKTEPRSFVIKGPLIKIIEKYMNLRPANATTNRFFLNYRNGKCTIQPIGTNKFKLFPRRIAEFLNLPNPQRYTGHSFRRTSTTNLANMGANEARIKRHGKWKSTKVAEQYIEDSLKYKSDTADIITTSLVTPKFSATSSTDQNSVMSKDDFAMPGCSSTRTLNETYSSSLTSTSQNSSVDKIPHRTDTSIKSSSLSICSSRQSHEIENIIIDDDIIEEFSQPMTLDSMTPNIFRNCSFNNCTFNISSNTLKSE